VFKKTSLKNKKVVKKTKPTVAKALADTAKIRYFKIGDRVKFLVYSLLFKKGIWARGAINGLNPAEWNITRVEWNRIYKNDPNYELISKGDSEMSFRIKDYNHMIIRAVIDKKYQKHLKPGHTQINFQATVSVKERAGQDGAYRKVGPHDSLVFENEKTPFHPLTRKSKPFKKMSKKEADDLPF